MINTNSKIFVAGHTGLVGSAILRRLKFYGYKNIVTVKRRNLDLTNQAKVFNFIKKKKLNVVIIAAAKVGGIKANYEKRAEFIYDNLSIQNNLIHGSFINGIKNLIFLGSSCVYPRNCKQPIKEDYLLTDQLEKTNEPYAVAKIAGIKMCESYNNQYNTSYKCLMPCNTYGPNDNYDKFSSHFFPAIIRKVHFAKLRNKSNLTFWGSGKPKRELIYVDDIADACIFFMKKKTKEVLINIGSGIEMSVKEYISFVVKHLDAKIEIKFDKSKFDGTPRKILDSNLAKRYGWRSKTDLRKGFHLAYENFLQRFHKSY